MCVALFVFAYPGRLSIFLIDHDCSNAHHRIATRPCLMCAKLSAERVAQDLLGILWMNGVCAAGISSLSLLVTFFSSAYEELRSIIFHGVFLPRVFLFLKWQLGIKDEFEDIDKELLI